MQIPANDIAIRFIKKEDIKQLVGLCAEHATYEKEVYNPSKKEEKLCKHIFSTKNNIRCLVVEKDDILIGYATVTKQFSTWDAKHYLYLDCLYLKEESRGKGLGKKLMQEIKKIAKREQCDLQWQTPIFNERAIQFYNSIGATHLSKERFFWNISEN